MANKLSVSSIVELFFDCGYLMIVTLMGMYLLHYEALSVKFMWGAMALVLVFGDCFHLVPRMIAIMSKSKSTKLKIALGTGKLITSITMTVFYVMLWHCALSVFLLKLPVFTAIIYALAIIRIALCLPLQNGWTKDSPSLRFAIYRNIPFVLQGIMVIIIFATHSSSVFALRFMWLAILLSFTFYIPVVLFSGKNSKVGMLMLPKTIAYVWIIAMGVIL